MSDQNDTQTMLIRADAEGYARGQNDAQLMRQSALYAALAKAQGSFKPIIPDRKVDVKMRDNKGSYSFRYATLGAVLDAVRDALSANGLAILTPPADDRVRVILAHSSGATEEASLPLSRRGDWQAFGSELTYARRYLVSALLCVASEWDDDGNRACGNEAVPQDEFDLWTELDKANVPTEPAARRAWVERVLQRDVPTSDAVRDIDVATLLKVAKGEAPMPPERQPKPTAAQLAALNAALDKLEPWGKGKLDGLSKPRAEALAKNAKLAWISAMLPQPRRISRSDQLTAVEVEKLTQAANNGEMPAADPLPVWMETDPGVTS